MSETVTISVVYQSLKDMGLSIYRFFRNLFIYFYYLFNNLINKLIN